jgi:acyl-CoA synthetase (AMP-forming)/AMP-acid ligase II
MSTPYQEFLKTCQLYGDHDFLHIPHIAASAYSESDITFTYLQMFALVDACAYNYQEKGYGVGHRVALFLENRANFFIQWLALNKIGCSIIPLNPSFNAEKLAYVINHSDTDLIVALENKITLVKNSVKLSGCSIPIVNVDDMHLLPSTKVQAKKNSIDESTESGLLYASSSGQIPKACILSNDYFIQLGTWYRDLGGLCELTAGKERLITPFPTVHMNGLVLSTMAMIMSGNCLIQLDYFRAETWWKTVKDSRATAIHYLGGIISQLMALPENKGDFIPQVKFGLGAGVNPIQHSAFEARFGFPLIELWAMAEVGGGGVTCANIDKHRYVGTRCFGKPSSKVEFKLVDNKLNAVSVGEIGELLIRSKEGNAQKGFFSGYLKDDEASSKVWEDGWFHTGDIVYEGAEGVLHFFDRKENVIYRNNQAISTLEIETILAGDKAIRDIIVMPVPDKQTVNEIMACIILKKEEIESCELAEAIILRSLTYLAKYKLPAYIVFINRFIEPTETRLSRADIKTNGLKCFNSGDVYNLCHLKQ